MYDLTILLKNNPGTLAEMGEALGSAGISIEGGGVFVVDGKAVAHFLFNDPEAARKALEEKGIKVLESREVLIQRLKQEQPGQLGKISRMMADAGVNIEVMYSDHQNQLILVVDNLEKGRVVCESWKKLNKNKSIVGEINMKYLTTILLLLICGINHAQEIVLETDTTLIIPKLKFDAGGELIITASATSSHIDFDFFVGNWKMHNRRLNERLANCNDWTEFESSAENFKILIGTGDFDIYYTTEMPGLEGKPFEGVTLRLFNPKTRLWSIYWAASNAGVLEPPVVGSFENNVGHFFTKDKFNGKDIIVMFRWDMRDKDYPVWSQAFSPDNGETWEWNWYNVSERIK